MHSLAFGFLWLFIFTIPWESVIVIPGFGGIPRLTGIVALGIGALLAIQRGVRRPGLAFWLALLFAMWASASLFWTISPGMTRHRIWTYLQLVGMLWLILEQTGTEQRRESLMRAFVFGALVAATSTIWNFVTGEARYIHEERYVAGQFDPNELGITLSMAIPMAWFLSLQATRASAVWLYRTLVPLLAFAVVLTASRSGLVALLVALTIVVWTASNLRPPQRAFLALSLPALGYFLFTKIPAGVVMRLATLGSEAGSMNSRVDIWRAGAEVFGEHPFVGVGAGGFAAAVGPVLGVGWSDSWAAHNSFLAVLVDLGLIGFGLFAALAVSSIVRIFRMPSALRRRVWLVIAVTYAVGALTLSWDYKKPTWLLFGLLGAPIAAHAESRRVRRRSAEGVSFAVPRSDVAAKP